MREACQGAPKDRGRPDGGRNGQAEIGLTPFILFDLTIES
jgi:hypothetical protein